MFKNPSTPLKGFTLVEMLLYVSICSIFLFSVSLLMGSLASSRVKNQVVNEVNQQGFQVMHLMTQTIRNARSIEYPARGASSSTLQLTTGDPILNPTFFFASSSVLYSREGGALPLSLTNKKVLVNNLIFENISASTSLEQVIKIRFTIDYDAKDLKEGYIFSKNFSGTATLRK